MSLLLVTTRNGSKYTITTEARLWARYSTTPITSPTSLSAPENGEYQKVELELNQPMVIHLHDDTFILTSPVTEITTLEA